MTKKELRPLLLKYNMLSKKVAIADHMYLHAGETSYYDDEWAECLNEMKEIRRDLRKCGYKFVCTSIKAVGEAYYNVYRIVSLYTAVY